MKLFLVLMLMGFSAQGAVDVICAGGDCFASGWDVTDMSTGNRSKVTCSEGDCFMNGWVSEYQGVEQNEVVCKPRGCFIEGWRTYSAQNFVQTGEVSCFRGSTGQTDCLVFGWETRTQYLRYPTFCLGGDCARRGWESRAQGYQPQVARCKEGGCFNTGWTVRP